MFAVYLKLTQHCKSVDHLHKHTHTKDHLQWRLNSND